MPEFARFLHDCRNVNEIKLNFSTYVLYAPAEPLTNDCSFVFSIGENSELFQTQFKNERNPPKHLANKTTTTTTRTTTANWLPGVGLTCVPNPGAIFKKHFEVLLLSQFRMVCLVHPV